MNIRPLHPTFAAELTGIDIAAGLSHDALEQIARALDVHGVVVLPGQTLSNEQQVAFGSRFGPIEPSVTRFRSDNAQRIAQREIVDVSNLDETGKPRRVDDRLRMLLLGNRLWHTDSSFRAVPGAVSMLLARTIPPEGGETEFADTRAAWDTLAPALQRRVEHARAVHSLMRSREQLGFTDFSPEELAALPSVEHPVVRSSPAHGRKALYVASHASHLVDMPLPEGRMVLLDLIEHATRREHVYTHRWRVGDLVLWDNRCTMHRGLSYDESFPRDMRRVTTSHVAERSVLDEVRHAATQPAAA